MKTPLPAPLLREAYRHAMGEITSAFAQSRYENAVHAGVPKEEIICHHLGLDWARKQTGWDAYKNGRAYEIKSETSTLSGKISLTKDNKQNLKKFQEYQLDNPIILLTGWTEDGRLVYILEIPFESTALAKKEGIRYRYHSGNTTLKVQYTDFEDCDDCAVLYCNLALLTRYNSVRGFRNWLLSHKTPETELVHKHDMPNVLF